jgi:hypothetical protein
MIILKSLFITTVISTLFAYGLRNIIGFWEAFCLLYAIQIIVAFVFSSKKISREQQIATSHVEEIEELLDMSMINIECPCGKNKFDTAVFASIDNIYECEVCGNKFKADITITPTLLTEPVSISKTFDNLIDKKEL